MKPAEERLRLLEERMSQFEQTRQGSPLGIPRTKTQNISIEVIG